jgi:hypothetical protein
MNVEIGTEAAQFPVKEYIKRDFPCSAAKRRTLFISPRLEPKIILQQAGALTT